MPYTEFTVLVDSVQMRPTRIYEGSPAPTVSTLVGAQDWDTAWCTAGNAFIDGSSGTAMITPAALDQALNWLNSNTGIYAKLPPTDFTLTPSSSDPNWSFPALNPDASQWSKYSDNTGGAGGITTYSVAVNQAIVVEFFVNPQTSSASPVVGCGWSSTGDVSAGVGLSIYNDLSFDIYVGGNEVGHYALAGQNADYGQDSGQVPAQTQNQYVRLLLIPCRQRELLVISASGGAYSFVFPTIPEGNPDNVPITPSEPLWFAAATGVDTTWRMALCQYQTSGYAIGKQSFFVQDPGASPPGGFQTWMSYDLQGCTLSCSVADGVNPYIAYAGATNGVRLNVAMTGTTISSGPYTPTVTPFVYLARGYTQPRCGLTAGGPLDVTDYVLDFSLDQADAVAGARATLTLKDPKGIIAAGYALDSTNQPGAAIQQITGRPWQIYDYDGNQIFEGINGPPKLMDGTYIDPDPASETYGQAIWGTATNPCEWVVFELSDPWKLAENTMFTDQIPLIGSTLLVALTTVSDYCGLTDSLNTAGAGARTWNMSSGLASYVLPAGGDVTNADTGLMIEPSDRASEWIDKLFKKFCGNCFLALVPMDGWTQPTLLEEADLPSSPALTLYDSLATATAQGVDDPTYLDLFRKIDVQMIAPEANDIYTQGKNYRWERPILAHKQDTTSGDPTIIPANRTPAWQGQPISYSWNDPDLSTQAAVNYACGLLYARLTIARSLIEIECDFSSLLSRGSQIELYFADGGGVLDSVTGELTNPAIGRIKSVSAKFVYTANDGRSGLWRPSKYVIQYGSDASMLYSLHTNIESILHDFLARTISQVMDRTDANDMNLFRRPLAGQAEV